MTASGACNLRPSTIRGAQSCATSNDTAYHTDAAHLAPMGASSVIRRARYCFLNGLIVAVLRRRFLRTCPPFESGTKAGSVRSMPATFGQGRRRGPGLVTLPPKQAAPASLETSCIGRAGRFARCSRLIHRAWPEPLWLVVEQVGKRCFAWVVVLLLLLKARGYEQFH